MVSAPSQSATPWLFAWSTSVGFGLPPSLPRVFLHLPDRVPLGLHSLIIFSDLIQPQKPLFSDFLGTCSVRRKTTAILAGGTCFCHCNMFAQSNNHRERGDRKLVCEMRLGITIFEPWNTKCRSNLSNELVNTSALPHHNILHIG